MVRRGRMLQHSAPPLHYAGRTWGRQWENSRAKFRIAASGGIPGAFPARSDTVRFSRFPGNVKSRFSKPGRLEASPLLGFPVFPVFPVSKRRGGATTRRNRELMRRKTRAHTRTPTGAFRSRSGPPGPRRADRIESPSRPGCGMLGGPVPAGPDGPALPYIGRRGRTRRPHGPPVRA